jgi:hypothetical protein
VQGGVTVQTTAAALAGAGALNYPFLTVGSTVGLTQARYLAASAGLSLTDGGVGSTLTINMTGAGLSLNAAGTGMVVKNSASTVAVRQLAVGAGMTVSDADGVSGNPTLGLNTNLQNLSSLSGTGLVTINGSTFSQVTINGTASQISVANGNGSGGSPTIGLASNPTVPGTGGMILPSGTLAERSPVNGTMRYNSSTGQFEGYAAGAWVNLGSGTAAGGSVTSVSFTGGLISVATPTTTPALTVAGTSGGVVYFSGASTWASSGVLGSGQIVLGGGAGASPTTVATIDNSYLSQINTTTTTTTAGNISRNGDWGFGTTAFAITDFTSTNLNYSQIFRSVSATGGPGVAISGVALPYDGGPTTSYLAVTAGTTTTNIRAWAGTKTGAAGTPVWTELARLASPTFTSNIGLGGISTAYLLSVAGSLTSATTTGGINISSTVQNDVTSTAYGVLANPTTAAVAFTLANFRGFQAGISLGAGSTVTNAFGFTASNLLGSNATNGYGFFSDLAAGANKFNFYANGTANNYMGGPLGLGTTSLTGFTFRQSLALTGSTGSYQNYSQGTIQSDVTANAWYYATNANTAVASFTCTTLVHYGAYQGTFGAGSTVTSQYGFLVDGSVIGATNDYGFYGNIGSGAGRWNLYMNGTAANYMGGVLGLGAASLTGYTFRNLLPITGATTSYQSQSGGAIQSDVTSTAVYNSTTASTVAAAFTLGNLYHFQANQGSIGAGSAVTNQFGFNVSSSMVGATNNYGYSLDYNELAGRWGLYFAGSAQNYINGAVGIGSTSVGLTSGIVFRVSRPLTGNTSAFGITSDGIIQSDVTSNIVLIRSLAQTQAASFTLTNLIHHQAVQGTFGAGSAVTVQSGFVADNTLIGATSNYGFRGSIASATGRWNVYMDGSAQNYFAGNVGIGSGKTVPAFPVDVNGVINGTYHAGSTATGLTATGTNLATALVLAAQANVVGTTPASTGVSLPNVLGTPIWVYNLGANSLAVYPNNASGTINSGPAGGADTLTSGSKKQYIQVATNTWFSI